MTKHTWSWYASSIISGVVGRPPTEPKNVNISGVSLKLGTKRMTELDYRWWWLKGWVRHQFGQHAWVPVERWRWIGETLDIDYQDESCWFCQARRARDPES